MKNFKKNNLMSLSCSFMTLGVLLLSNNIFAQGGGGPIPPHVLPLTGGIGALLAMGIGAGIFYYRKKKK